MVVGLDHRHLLDTCHAAGLIDEDAVARGLRRNGDDDPIRTVSLVGRVTRRQVLAAVAADFRLPLVPRTGLDIDRQAWARLPAALRTGPRLVPLVQRGSGPTTVALADPRDHQAVELAGRSLGRRCRPALADPRDLNRSLAPEGGSAADTVGWVDELLVEAWCHRATDIHLDPEVNGYRVRFRVDGQLEEVVDRLVPARAVAAISRVKVLAGLDISETRAPQDGGCRLELSVDRKRWIDARVAIIPTHRGERLCVRLLGVGAEAVTLDTLGLDAHDLTLVRSIIERPHGLVLVTGATGSGKSTTLYAALRDLVRPERNLLTIEDPVEYRVPGVSQIQVDHDGRVGFAAALRSVLRHDPDILLVGEIRDAETAALALQAASTGHLVLATLHTNTAVDAPGRLRDLGCPPWLVAATLRLVVNQRLMPRLCRTCRQEEPGLGWTAPGCPACSGRGYRGRVPVFELLPIDRERADAIANGVVAGDVLAAGAGHRPLDADLTRKADQGLIDHRCLLAEAVA